MSQNPERNRCQPEVLQIDSQCRQDYQEQERMAERPSLFSRSEGQKAQGLVDYVRQHRSQGQKSQINPSN